MLTVILDLASVQIELLEGECLKQTPSLIVSEVVRVVPMKQDLARFFPGLFDLTVLENELHLFSLLAVEEILAHLQEAEILGAFIICLAEELQSNEETTLPEMNFDIKRIYSLRFERYIFCELFEQTSSGYLSLH